MVLPDKKDNLEIKRQVVELFELENRFKDIKKQYEDRKERLTVAIKNYMYCNKGIDNGFQFYAKSKTQDKMFNVKKIEPSTIVWDADKLEKMLSKEDARQVIEKTYTITDIDGLIAYLKSCGVNSKRFKSFIDVSKKVNNDTLEQLDAVGKLDRDDLSGCYTVSKKSSYLRISMTEDEI